MCSKSRFSVWLTLVRHRKHDSVVYVQQSQTATAVKTNATSNESIKDGQSDNGKISTQVNYHYQDCRISNILHFTQLLKGSICGKTTGIFNRFGLRGNCCQDRLAYCWYSLMLFPYSEKIRKRSDRNFRRGMMLYRKRRLLHFERSGLFDKPTSRQWLLKVATLVVNSWRTA